MTALLITLAVSFLFSTLVLAALSGVLSHDGVSLWECMRLALFVAFIVTGVVNLGLISTYEKDAEFAKKWKTVAGSEVSVTSHTATVTIPSFMTDARGNEIPYNQFHQMSLRNAIGLGVIKGEGSYNLPPDYSAVFFGLAIGFFALPSIVSLLGLVHNFLRKTCKFLDRKKTLTA